MDIETRLSNLENLAFSLAETINRNKFYGDADTAGAKKSIGDITPYKETKIAYYGETEKTFYNVPQGNLSVFFDNYNGSYNVSRLNDTVTISFDALENDTNITIMIQ